MAYHVEGRDLVIDGFEKGIADSPYQGIADLRNVNVISVPNEVSVAFATSSFNLAIHAATNVTVQAAGDTVSYAGTALYAGACVTFSSTANGITAGTKYWVGNIAGGNTVKLYTDWLQAVNGTGASLVDITSDGTNTMTQLPMGLPKHWAYDASASYFNYFVQDSTEFVWGLRITTNQWICINAGESGNSNGNGLVAYHGWLYNFHSKDFQTIKTDFYTTTWSGTSYVLNGTTGTSHYAIVGYDDIMYYTDGAQLGSVAAKDPYFRMNVTSADVGTNELALNYTYGPIPAVNSSVVFQEPAGATLPAPLTVGTVYYIRSFGSSAYGNTHFSVSTTPGGAVVDITANGTGLCCNMIPPTANGDNGSAVMSINALALPAEETAQSIAELGDTLLIGATTNKLYPWDRLSNSSSAPILVAERNIQKLVTVNATTYIFAGNRGRIYKTNGSQATLYKKIPDSVTGVIEPYITWHAFGYNRNQIYFSFSAKNNAGIDLTTSGGLWAIDIDTDSIRFVNKLSYDTYAGYASVFIPIQSTSDTGNGFGFFAGWSNGSTYGIDKSSASPYSNYETYIETDFIPVGTLWERRTCEQIEYFLGAPMVSGEGVKIEYRTNLTASWASAGNFQSSTDNTSTVAGTISDILIPTFENVQWIQLRVSTKSTASSPSYTRLRTIRIR